MKLTKQIQMAIQLVFMCILLLYLVRHVLQNSKKMLMLTQIGSTIFRISLCYMLRVCLKHQHDDTLDTLCNPSPDWATTKDRLRGPVMRVSA